MPPRKGRTRVRGVVSHASGVSATEEGKAGNTEGRARKREVEVEPPELRPLDAPNAGAARSLKSARKRVNERQGRRGRASSCGVPEEVAFLVRSPTKQDRPRVRWWHRAIPARLIA